MILPTPLQALPPPTHNFSFVVDEFAPICGHEARSLLRNHLRTTFAGFHRRPVTGRPRETCTVESCDIDVVCCLENIRWACHVQEVMVHWTPVRSVRSKAKETQGPQKRTSTRTRTQKKGKKRGHYSTDCCCHQTTKGGSRGDGKNKNTTFAHSKQ